MFFHISVFGEFDTSHIYMLPYHQANGMKIILLGVLDGNN